MKLFCIGFFLLTGCATAPAPRPPAPTTDPAPALTAGAEKDAAILTAARAITARKTDPDFVAVSANRILDLIRLSPWAKTEEVIRSLTRERDEQAKAAKESAQALAQARVEAQEAERNTTRVIRLGLASLGALFSILAVIGAVLVAKVATVFPLLGRDVILGLGGLAALFFLASFAYGWAAQNQGLVMGIAGVLFVGVGALLWANFRHEKLASEKRKPTIQP